MNTPLRLATFGLGLAAAFAAAFGVGSAIGPVGPAVEISPAGHDDRGGENAGPHEEGHR